MTDKLKHTPAAWSSDGSRVFHQRNPGGMKFFICELFRDHFATVKGNAALIVLAPTAPHDCDDPHCPGNINRRKLEAFDEIRQALVVLVAEIEQLRTVYIPHVDEARAALKRAEEIT